MRRELSAGIWTMATTALLFACSGGGGGTTEPAVGSVAGTVTSAGSGLAGVQVTVTGRPAVVTGSDGRYTVTGVPAGTHTIRVTVPSGQELTAGEAAEKTVTVAASQTATVNWSMQVRAPTTATVDTVRMSGTTFSPSSLTVKTGSTIVWVNMQTMTHTVTPDGHSQWARAESSSPGEVLRATITEAGTFDYYCEPHRSSGMTGRIVVQP